MTASEPDLTRRALLGGQRDAKAEQSPSCPDEGKHHVVNCRGRVTAGGFQVSLEDLRPALRKLHVNKSTLVLQSQATEVCQ